MTHAHNAPPQDKETPEEKFKKEVEKEAEGVKSAVNKFRHLEKKFAATPHGKKLPEYKAHYDFDKTTMAGNLVTLLETKLKGFEESKSAKAKDLRVKVHALIQTLKVEQAKLFEGLNYDVEAVNKAFSDAQKAVTDLKNSEIKGEEKKAAEGVFGQAPELSEPNLNKISEELESIKKKLPEQLKKLNQSVNDQKAAAINRSLALALGYKKFDELWIDIDAPDDIKKKMQEKTEAALASSRTSLGMANVALTEDDEEELYEKRLEAFRSSSTGAWKIPGDDKFIFMNQGGVWRGFYADSRKEITDVNWSVNWDDFNDVQNKLIDRIVLTTGKKSVGFSFEHINHPQDKFSHSGVDEMSRFLDVIIARNQKELANLNLNPPNPIGNYVDFSLSEHTRQLLDHPHTNAKKRQQIREKISRIHNQVDQIQKKEKKLFSSDMRPLEEVERETKKVQLQTKISNLEKLAKEFDESKPQRDKKAETAADILEKKEVDFKKPADREALSKEMKSIEERLNRIEKAYDKVESHQTTTNFDTDIKNETYQWPLSTVRDVTTDEAKDLQTRLRVLGEEYKKAFPVTDNKPSEVKDLKDAKETKQEAKTTEEDSNKKERLETLGDIARLKERLNELAARRAGLDKGVFNRLAEEQKPSGPAATFT